MDSVDQKLLDTLLWIFAIAFLIGLFVRLKFSFWVNRNLLIGWMCFVVMGFACMVGCYQVYHQYGAKRRLQALGIEPYPGFEHAQNASGGRAPRYVWRFKVAGSRKDLVKFYTDPAHIGSWHAKMSQSGMLLLESTSGVIEMSAFGTAQYGFDLGILFKPAH